MTSLRIVLAGDEAAGARALALLLRSNHDVVAVAAPRGIDNEPGALWQRATEHGLTVFDARRLHHPDTANELIPVRPDVLLNVHSLTKVASEVLDVFAVGAWNLHPGPLPEGAGINVPSWAISERWSRHGVTLHRMTAEYDEGVIAYEDRFPIDQRATGLTLSAECASRGIRLVKRLIDQLSDDPATVPEHAQDLTARAYYGLGQPNGGIVEWSMEAASIDAAVRAADFRPFPSPWHWPQSELDGEWVELVDVEVGELSDEAPGTTRSSQNDGHVTTEVATRDRWLRLVETKPIDAPRVVQQCQK